MLIKRAQPAFFGPSLLNDVSGFLGATCVAPSETRMPAFPHVDARETDHSFIIQADTPGFESDDIELTFDDDVLTIRGARETHSDEVEGSLQRRERWTGSFERRLRLPSSIDVDQVTADLEQGVLTVTLPKSTVAQPRRIQVGS